MHDKQSYVIGGHHMYISSFSTINNEEYIGRAVGISADHSRNLIRKIGYMPELASVKNGFGKFNNDEIFLSR